jgi:hypothetical protein
MFSRKGFWAWTLKVGLITKGNSPKSIIEQVRLEIITKFADHELQIIGLFQGFFQFLHLFHREDVLLLFLWKLLQGLPSLIEGLPCFGIGQKIGFEFFSLFGG